MSKTAFARVFALIVLASLAVACGGGEEKAAKEKAAAVQAEKAKEAAAPPAVSAKDAGMANAVAVGKTSAAVDLKYDLTSKPAVGQPFEVELAFFPRLAAESLEIEAAGMPGLTVASGGTAKFENVVAGERYAAKVLVQVDQPGMYYIGVTARMVSKVQTEARTFSVPLVVGTLPAEEKPTAAAGAAVPAETVKSMKAVETTTPAETKK